MGFNDRVLILALALHILPALPVVLGFWPRFAVIWSRPPAYIAPKGIICTNNTNNTTLNYAEKIFISQRKIFMFFFCGDYGCSNISDTLAWVPILVYKWVDEIWSQIVWAKLLSHILPLDSTYGNWYLISGNNFHSQNVSFSRKDAMEKASIGIVELVSVVWDGLFDLL